MKSDNDTASSMAELLEEMMGENSSPGSCENIESSVGNAGSPNSPNSSFVGGDGQIVLNWLRHVAQMGKRLDAIEGATPVKPISVGGGSPDPFVDRATNSDVKEKGRAYDDGDDKEKAAVILIQKRIDGAAQTVDDQFEALNKLVDTKLDLLDAKVNSLQERMNDDVNSLEEIMKMVEQIYQSRGMQSTKASPEEVKVRQMRLSHIKKALNQCNSFVVSFNDDFVWKDKGSSVYSGPGIFAWHSCRLDCPLTRVGFVYQWTIQIQDGDVGVGIIPSVHQFDVKKFLGHQKGGWCYQSNGLLWCNGEKTKRGLMPFGSGNNVTLTLDLSDVSKDKTTGGILKATIEGQHDEIILFDDIIKQGADIGMDFDNNKDGFYPAVSCYKDSRVKFLGFQSVE